MVNSNLCNLLEGLKNGIGTLDLACKARNFVEKFIWVAIGVLGTVWAFYFIGKEILNWSTNPTIITQGNVELSDIEYPSITICPPGSTKFAMAERLGNYVDPSFIKSQKFLSLANKYFVAFLNFNYGITLKEYDHFCKEKKDNGRGCNVSCSS